MFFGTYEEFGLEITDDDDGYLFASTDEGHAAARAIGNTDATAFASGVCEGFNRFKERFPMADRIGTCAVSEDGLVPAFP